MYKRQGLGIAIECFIPKEKSDERAVQNLQKADAFILNGIYIIAAWLMLWTLWAPEMSLALAAGEIALAFALLGFLRSALFLAFEQFGA